MKKKLLQCQFNTGLFKVYYNINFYFFIFNIKKVVLFYGKYNSK